MSGGPVRLHAWPAARVRLFDLVPAQTGAPRAGAPVALVARDGLVEGPVVTWEADIRRRQGLLEEILDDDGQPALSVDDSVFRGLLPIEARPPHVLAAYHLSFLRRRLGGPRATPPYGLCLYRATLQHRPWLSGHGLQTMAVEVAPGKILDLTEAGPHARLACGQALLEALLATEPLNRLVARSGAPVLPPPHDEPFGRFDDWDLMESGPVFVAD
ncbi:hypothetical protein AA12717_1689 [Gluconacetobacter sacchari DSM 12717]|uniref:Uncharacterized protein n=2 Tax=Gluconacetobacter sacchari TaxID=92759 RepID=A0A7W4IE70_9PROT|nr:hypothetical protein [Gluconacetobacter sacchari]MBB2161200.1 hypothetical protein [Gluconacetobacter sacchari]GBQ24097.1 hypothetical protein AA12717_1689 [Gluconacetobacter sacchari DSM 12717]